MSFDPSTLAPVIGSVFIGASTLLLTFAIGWRLAVRPTLRAMLEFRAARNGDPQLRRRLTELEDEVRTLKEQLAQLPEVTASRGLIGLPWRGSRERA